MAETTIPIINPVPLGFGQVITPVALVAANGCVVNNTGGNLIFYLKNTDASASVTVTATIITDKEQNRTILGKPLTLTAGQYGVMGPYADHSTDGLLHFVVTLAGTGDIYAMRPIPPLY